MLPGLSSYFLKKQATDRPTVFVSAKLVQVERNAKSQRANINKVLHFLPPRAESKEVYSVPNVIKHPFRRLF